MKPILLAIALALSATAANAEVLDAQANGFALKREAVIRAPAERVWAALIKPSTWWNKDHTWSGAAANLSLAPMAGGCFCERLPNGGSVQHLAVVYAQPNVQLTLFGGLGPLQSSGAAGHLVWSLAEKDGQTTLTWTYTVGGYVKGGLDRWAKPVDGVLGEQLDRLKALVETPAAP